MKRDLQFWADMAGIVATIIALLAFLQALFGWRLPWSPRIGIAIAAAALTVVSVWVLFRAPRLRVFLKRWVTDPRPWIVLAVVLLVATLWFYSSFQRLERTVVVQATEVASAHAMHTALVRTAAVLESTRVAQATDVALARATVTQLLSEVATLQARSTTTVTPTPGMVSVRSGPSRYHAIIGAVQQGDQVDALAEYTNRDDELWYKIKTAGGSLGWVPALLVERADPESILPIECPLAEVLASDEEVFKALVEAERQAVLEESNLDRNERLALIYLVFAKNAVIYDMTSPLRPWDDPIQRYEEKLDREINREIIHTQFSIAGITPLFACVQTDSRGIYMSRAAPTPIPYSNPLGADEWRFERVNGCWAIRQFVFRINPDDPKHKHEPCALDWPGKQ